MPKSSDLRTNQFRPEPLLPPKLGQTLGDYEAYVASYQLYTDTLSHLRHSFWKDVEMKNAGERKISTVKVTKGYHDGLKSYSILPAAGGQALSNTGPFKTERELYQSFGSKLGINPKVANEGVYRQTFSNMGHTVVTTETGTKPYVSVSSYASVVKKSVTPSPPAKLPERKSNPAQKTARNRRQRAARASRKRSADTLVAKQRTDRLTAILASAKVGAKLDGWNVVQNKKRQRKAARSNAATGDKKSSPT